MLSTKYRLRLEFICNRIINGEEVQLNDMIWANKLAKANRSAYEMLNKARRIAANPDVERGGLDDFMIQMGLGDLIIQRDSKTQMRLQNGFIKKEQMIGGKGIDESYCLQ